MKYREIQNYLSKIVLPFQWKTVNMIMILFREQEFTTEFSLCCKQDRAHLFQAFSMSQSRLNRIDSRGINTAVAQQIRKPDDILF